VSGRVVDEFWLKLVLGGGGALGLALFVIRLFTSRVIVTGKSAEESLTRQAEECARHVTELERSLAYEREQKRELQEDCERWILRYTDAADHVRRAKEVARASVKTAKEIASRSSQ
jgi:hypothetical protein